MQETILFAKVVKQSEKYIKVRKRKCIKGHRWKVYVQGTDMINTHEDTVILNCRDCNYTYVHKIGIDN